MTTTTTNNNNNNNNNTNANTTTNNNNTTTTTATPPTPAVATVTAASENIIIFNKTENLIEEIKRERNSIKAINLIEYDLVGLEYIDKNGWTALHWASYMGSHEIVKILINYNVKIDRKTLHGLNNKDDEFKGKTAKEIAMKMGYKDIVKILNKKNFIEGSKKIYKFIKDTAEIVSAF
ncbi:hypothetical protein BCR32DRAFT_330634, partial [Anaeromyces robustus]